MFAGFKSECIRWLLDAPDGEVYEVKRRRRRRSLTQNAYYWALLNRLAAALGMGDSELHERMLREYGACEVFSVREDVPYREYFAHCDEVGEGVRQRQAIRAREGVEGIKPDGLGRVLAPALGHGVRVRGAGDTDVDAAGGRGA